MPTKMHALVDRNVGQIIKRKRLDEDSARRLDGPLVWLPIDDPGAPAHDPAFQTVTSAEVMPDLPAAGPIDPAAAVTVTWTVHGPDLATAKAIATAAAAAEADRRLALITAGYATLERATWEQQLAEAVAYQADPGAATPLLDALPRAGETKAELAATVLAKADAFKAAAAPVIQALREHRAAIDAAAAPADAMTHDVTAGWPA